MGDMVDYITQWDDVQLPRRVEYESWKFLEVVRETDRAWQIKLNATEKAEWFPKSWCKINRNGKIIKVPDWLVLRKLQNKKVERKQGI